MARPMAYEIRKHGKVYRLVARMKSNEGKRFKAFMGAYATPEDAAQAAGAVQQEFVRPHGGT